MKAINFNIQGGYPLVQESLAFMQDSFLNGLKAMGNALNIHGGSRAVILTGVEQILVGTSLSISEGYIVWEDGEILYVPATTLNYSAGATLYFAKNTQAHPILDPTHYALSGQVQDVHLETFAIISYANPAGSLPLNEDNRYKNMIANYGNSPLGSIVAYAGLANSIPQNWKLCDGSTLNYILNPPCLPLYGVIGTLYGAGINASDFKVPDLRDRFILGAGSIAGVAGVGGSQTAALIEANLPQHVHSIGDDGNHSHNVVNGDNVLKMGSGSSSHNTGNTSIDIHEVDISIGTDGLHDHGGTTSGGNGTAAPFQILPPFFALSYIIRVY